MAFYAMPYLSDTAQKVAHVNKSEKGMAANHQILRASLGEMAKDGLVEEVMKFLN